MVTICSYFTCFAGGKYYMEVEGKTLIHFNVKFKTTCMKFSALDVAFVYF